MTLLLCLYLGATVIAGLMGDSGKPRLVGPELVSSSRGTLVALDDLSSEVPIVSIWEFLDNRSFIFREIGPGSRGNVVFKPATRSSTNTLPEDQAKCHGVNSSPARDRADKPRSDANTVLWWQGLLLNGLHMKYLKITHLLTNSYYLMKFQASQQLRYVSERG